MSGGADAGGCAVRCEKAAGQKYQLIMLGFARVGIMTRLSVSVRYTKRRYSVGGALPQALILLRVLETGSGWVSAGVGIPFKYISRLDTWGLQRINCRSCRSRKHEEPDRARCCREKGLKSSSSRMRYTGGMLHHRRQSYYSSGNHTR